MIERKLIGYTERDEGFYPMYAPLQGSIVTQAFILCRYCQGAISPNMGPRSDAVCLTCYVRSANGSHQQKAMQDERFRPQPAPTPEAASELRRLHQCLRNVYC